ncbi:hypothetical protein [Natrinema gelatinilyticum]|uniref:hypothetical protein n=1 Tax=Natrinema gelatinilyticum TaxID=2961571 RepID=UPI0020C51EEB|nr:hypothetical protein [Natrinema gelatinilyticum]
MDFEQRVDYQGQIVRGRDDELFGIIPFILHKSELGRKMEKAEKGVFTFSVTVEDNKRIYSTSIEVSTKPKDSTNEEASRKLRQ